MKLFAYIPHPDFAKELEKELGSNQALFFFQHPELILTVKDLKSVWAQQIWKNCDLIEIESIGDAQKKLKEIGGLWIPTSFQLHRRTQLIAEKVPTLRPQKFKFPPEKATEKTIKSANAFCLIEEKKMLVSTEVYPPLPNGIMAFDEDKNAPSRAYQKLWETFLLYAEPPKPSDRVIDLGSSPGGWTQVLAQIGCETISVDTALLDAHLLKIENIKFMQEDAFKIKPLDIGKCAWLFSDIICDPRRLYALVQNWIKSGCVKNFVCTIKFKGETDNETLKKFQKIPNSKIVHLSSNKHELTWIKLA